MAVGERHPSAGKAPLLEVDHLNKALGSGPGRTQIIGDLNFSVHEGEFISIVGPSGCGKTTLLMCLSGLYAPDRGAVSVKGRHMSGTPAEISIVFQDYSRSLLPWKSNLDNVLFGMRRLREMKAREKREMALETLSSVGLAGFEKHYPWQLSGGMQQRVAIARALSARSELLLLDEPLAAVDAQTRAEMQDLLLDLARRFRQTCLLVTHDVDEAVYLADRLVVLSQRPTSVVEELAVPLPKPRDQLATKEDRLFLEIRHRVLASIHAMRKATPERANGP